MHLAKKIELKIQEIAAIANVIPAPIIIHSIPQFRVLFMSEVGLNLLGVSREEVEGLSVEEYQRRFFNPDDTKNYVPKMMALINNNSDETISYFHQVKTSRTRDWDWYLGLTKILMRDENNTPALSITLAMRVDPEHFFTAKAHKLLNENEFLKENYERYAALTDREREVLRELALGKSAGEVADALHISTLTAETHRKNLKRKLEAENHYVLSTYARVFDLI